ncbi:hypothetical protein BDV41DRAFT_558834 [Aspergillus transmontanensis]|uniref:Uncharacterized protein n=1 Tax=Aspergillus transmontanensis TaxID=1034304 RepID=A0A5N6VDI4_9EURO|nr:hypothetical protein BDV41DRAFT_558834 [Aspergillus transmontanensis]
MRRQTRRDTRLIDGRSLSGGLPPVITWSPLVNPHEQPRSVDDDKDMLSKSQENNTTIGLLFQKASTEVHPTNGHYNDGRGGCLKDLGHKP